MKKVLALVLALAMVIGLVGTVHAEDKIKIGISIWSSTDTLGSEVKRLIDAAAETLGVETAWVDQAHISEQVTASAEQLAMADCDGMIICNSASAEMGSVIKTCDENEMYVAQFFRVIDEAANPDEYAQAKASKYYVGCVHESEFDNGKELVTILGNKGCKKIGLEGWEPGDATFLGRWEGYKAGVEAWNAEHPDDTMVLLEPQYGRTTTDTGRQTADAILDRQDRRGLHRLPARPGRETGNRRHGGGIRRTLRGSLLRFPDGLQRHPRQLCHQRGRLL